MDLELALDHQLVAVQTEQELHLLVELTAPEAPVSTERQPLRVALVIDRSGSMGGAKLAAAKQCAGYLVDRLAADDQLAIVAYDDKVDLVAPLAPVDPAVLGPRIAAMQPGGMTNLSGGWLKGAEELQRVDDGIRRVLLLSDGHANEGITDPARLASVATGLVGQGVSTTTIGFGDGFDEHLMTEIADAGRGAGYFAETPDDAPGIFAEEFDDLVALVAQNVSVEIRPTDDVDVVAVLNTFPSVPVPGGVQVQVGDAFGGQRIRVVAKLRIPALASLGLATVGEVVVRWVAVGDDVAQHSVTSTLTVNAVSADDAASAGPDPKVVEEVTILAAGRAAEEAQRLASEGDFDGARRVVDDAVGTLQALPADHPAAEQLRRAVSGLQQTSASLAASAFSPADAKRLHYQSRNLRSRKKD